MQNMSFEAEIMTIGTLGGGTVKFVFRFDKGSVPSLQVHVIEAGSRKTTGVILDEWGIKALKTMLKSVDAATAKSKELAAFLESSDADLKIAIDKITGDSK